VCQECRPYYHSNDTTLADTDEVTAITESVSFYSNFMEKRLRKLRSSTENISERIFYYEKLTNVSLPRAALKRTDRKRIFNSNRIHSGMADR